jgi:Gpi18-like mannosyltransferase
VYNPKEQVLGTITPLYTLVLVIIGKITGGHKAPFPEIALIINDIADFLTCLLLIDLGRRLGSTLGGIATALVWAIAPFSSTFAIGGMETSVYVLLLTAIMAAYIHRRF